MIRVSIRNQQRCLRPFWIVALGVVCASLFVMPSGCYAQEEAKEAAETKEAGESGEHHDETDLTEANASDMLTSAAEWRFDQVLASIVIFFVLFLILAKLAWKPITQGLDA